MIISAVHGLQRTTRQIAAYFEGIDVLLTPTLGEPPAPLGTFDSPPGEPLTGFFRSAAYVPFTPPFNVTGQPASPCRWTGTPRGCRSVCSSSDAWRRGDAAGAGGAARGGGAVGRAEAAGLGLTDPTRSWAVPLCRTACASGRTLRSGDFLHVRQHDGVQPRRRHVLALPDEAIGEGGAARAFVQFLDHEFRRRLQRDGTSPCTGAVLSQESPVRPKLW